MKKMRKPENRNRIRLILSAVLLCTAFFAVAQTAYADMGLETATPQEQTGGVTSGLPADAGEPGNALAPPVENTTADPTDPPLRNGWDGRCYYRNGELLKGVQEVDGALYYFHMETGKYWINAYKTHNEKMYFFGDNGKGAVFSGICKLNDRYYRNGVKFTGMKDYCYYRSGRKYTGTYNGYYYRNGKKYTGFNNNYYYKNGKKYTGFRNGYYYRSGKKYTGFKDNYYYKNGKKFTGTRNGYYYKGGKKYTGTRNGYYYRNGRKYTGFKDNCYYRYGKKYTGMRNGYYYKGGKKYTGIKGKYYYSKGKISKKYRSTVRKINGTVRYFYKDGTIKRSSGWVRANGKRYYIRSGKGLTGWHYVGNYKYYFKSSGVLTQDLIAHFGNSWKKKNLLIRVNRQRNCVTIYAKDGKRGYTIPVKALVCSVGLRGTPTVKGTYHVDKARTYRWHTLGGESMGGYVYGQYCSRITGGYLFHSVTYRRPNNRTLITSAYNNLGNAASHGCVRLRVIDAKLVYEIAKYRKTTVVIYDNSDAGPFDKPKIKKIPAGQNYEPTDPNI